MIKKSSFVRIKDESDIVDLGWYKKGEIAKVVGVIDVNGPKHDKLYLIENQDKVRVGVYEEDIEEVG